jgi:hypothetical protein
MNPIQLACLIDVALGIILLLSAFVIKSKSQKLNWKAWLIAGAIGIIIGLAGMIITALH